MYLEVMSVYRFKECREEKGFSQKFVALSLNVKAPSVSEWENGKSNPTLENLIALSNLLGVSCDDLLGQPSSSNMQNAEARFSPEETQLILDYRHLSETNKIGIQNNIQFLLSIQNKEKESNGTIIA